MAKQRKLKPRKKRKKATPQEIEQRNHRSDIRAVFRNAGFEKVVGVSDKEFTFNEATSDFDDVFIYENILVFTEYTTTQSSGISGHLKPKKIVYDTILNNTSDFIEFYENTFPIFKEARDDFFDYNQCEIIILYCSKNSINPKYKTQIPNIFYFDYPVVRYFKSVSDAIKKSSRFEIFIFLGLTNDKIGKASLTTGISKDDYKGSVLPHSHSNFEKGYKVVSFYIDPQSLLKRSYVLRKDGWRDQGGLYQRMISKAKINSIRKYLNSKERVFINNIIVTLPSTTKLVDSKSNTVNPDKLTKTEPVIIQIPNGFNVIGLIDGQHRVFSYHEGGEFDLKIQKLSEKQNLLVTGIIYPANIKDIDKTKFEANLFLEINSTQVKTKSDLKQAIGLLLKPFSSESIAKATINRLNNSSGPLEDQFERHFYDSGKIKTTSIVSYGLKPIIKLSGIDSFYSIWNNTDKKDLLNEDNVNLLNDYIDYCSYEINQFLIAIKIKINNSKWTTKKDEKSKVLSTTAINGFIICLRKIIENGKIGDQKFYENKLSEINTFDFSKYKSSQYGQMGRDFYDKFFA
jgi:DGQHR domain-containing protein